MTKLQKRRLYFVITLIAGIALAASFMLVALKQNINIFFTPSQLTNTPVSTNNHLRPGGIVKSGSVIRTKNDLAVQFIITDLHHDVPVRYIGVLPDLFREGKGVVAEGHLTQQGIFIANQVLAKHDENYMPKNVYQAMRHDNHTTI